MTDQPLLFEDLHVDVAAQRVAQEREQRRREAEEGERRKADGMRLATTNKEHLLARAREFAFDIARGVEPHADGQKRADWLVNADDVFAAWQRDNDRRAREGLACVPWIGNAAGHLFQTPNWECVGMVKSYRSHAHRNLLRQWKWKHKAP